MYGPAILERHGALQGRGPQAFRDLGRAAQPGGVDARLRSLLHHRADQDRELGFKSKGDCHAGAGILHRAFSIFVFNHHNELLLQKRSGTKLLWPNYWSNTCCSHPRRGESMGEAVTRRLVQELGFACPLEYLYKFKYRAEFGEIGAGLQLAPNAMHVL